MTKFHVPEPSYGWDETVEGVKIAAAECGEPLSGAEYDNWLATSEEDFPTSSWIRRQFGWKEVCNRAGIQYGRGTEYTAEDVLLAVERAAADVGEPLAQHEYRSWREGVDKEYPSVSTITDRFDWEEACEKVGVSAARNNPATEPIYTEDEISSAVERAAADVGEPLAQDEYSLWWDTDDDAPSVSTVTNRFEDWEEACEKAGVSGVVKKRAHTDDDEISSAVERAAADVGEPLAQTEYNEWRQDIDGDPPSISVVNRVGWEDICERANVRYKYHNTYSNSDLVDAVERAAADVGEPLTKTEYRVWRDNTDGEIPSLTTVRTRLGWDGDSVPVDLK